MLSYCRIATDVQSRWNRADGGWFFYTPIRASCPEMDFNSKAGILLEEILAAVMLDACKLVPSSEPLVSADHIHEVVHGLNNFSAFLGDSTFKTFSARTSEFFLQYSMHHGFHQHLRTLVVEYHRTISDVCAEACRKGTALSLAVGSTTENAWLLENKAVAEALERVSAVSRQVNAFRLDGIVKSFSEAFVQEIQAELEHNFDKLSLQDWITALRVCVLRTVLLVRMARLSPQFVGNVLSGVFAEASPLSPYLARAAKARATRA